MPDPIKNDAFSIQLSILKKLIVNNDLDRAFKLLTDYVAPISDKLGTMLILNQAAHNDIITQKASDLITAADAKVELAKIKMNLLVIMDLVPEELEIKQLLENLNPSLYTTSPLPNLEKIQGNINNLVDISWIEHAKEKSKSVCQVVRADGKRGTGFVLKGGYLLTNFHVLPTAERASEAKIIFNYERDLQGNLRQTSEYRLDSSDFQYSIIKELDFAYVKIIDDPTNPLSNWGYLEPETFKEPQVDEPVTIIQHPKGEVKQIALTANKVISVFGNKLMYETDTEPGSSGSPVFNNDWKVVALHHAGKDDEDGGLIINAAGDRKGANEGILIKPILQKLNLI